MGRPERAPFDLRRLRYFVAVCDHGGFSRAAQAIGVAQPALTRQVQLLESELGLPLVRRTGRGAVPTEPGRALLARARAHLDGLDGLAAALRHEFAAATAPARVGLCPTIAPLFLDALRAWFALRHPGPEPVLLEAYSGDLDGLLAGGHIDAALTYRPLGTPAHPTTDLLAERLVLVARADRAARGPASLEEIAGMRLILPAPLHRLRQIVDAAALRRGLALRPELELNSLAAVRAALDDPRGDHVTILPANSLGEEPPGGVVLRPIDDPGMTRTVSLVTGPDGAERLPRGLLDHLRTRAAALWRERPSLSPPDP